MKRTFNTCFSLAESAFYGISRYYRTRRVPIIPLQITSVLFHHSYTGISPLSLRSLSRALGRPSPLSSKFNSAPGPSLHAHFLFEAHGVTYILSTCIRKVVLFRVPHNFDVCSQCDDHGFKTQVIHTSSTCSMEADKLIELT